MSELQDASVLALAERLGVVVAGVDRKLALLNILEAVGKTGLVVLLKYDGERKPESGDNGVYTAMISDPSSQGEFYRRDDDSFAEALEYVFRAYSRSLTGESQEGPKS